MIETRMSSGLLFLCLATPLACSQGDPQAATSEAAIAVSYPETQQGDFVETLHGVEVPDPYRWLEDLDSPQTEAWVEAQNEVTFGYLQGLPGRDALQARLTELWDYPKYGVPFEEGGLYFFQRNTGLQNQSVLYVTEDLGTRWRPEGAAAEPPRAERGSGLGAEPRVLLDPNTLSEDGTRVPMFLTARKGVLDAEGTHPTLVYGYGGFNISVVPSFSVTNLVWMEQGGIYASVNLRGGGEYGKRWHEAGMLHNKQNVFDDFIAAAEWLVDNGYTTPQKLAMRGGSNGGLLVGAVMTQRPDLVAVALPAVGVLDMLRFHEFTIGWAWTSDYGDPEAPEDFEYLLGYSPYHNLEPGADYPATLLTTADHDDRVVPAHSFKFASRLQRAHAGDDPVLIRVETRAGHGAGKPTTKQIEEARDVLAFALYHVGHAAGEGARREARGAG